MARKSTTTFSLRRSSAGLGLYTTKSIKKGETVIEYIGERITTEEANRRGGKYLAELNDRWTIDGKTRKNLARYINHSCKPNCYYELNEAETRIFAIAKRNIEAGEELSVHYGKEYWQEHIAPFGCRCPICSSAKNHSPSVTGRGASASEESTDDISS